MYTKTQAKHSHSFCLPPSIHILMVHRPNETEEYVPIPAGIDGRTLHAAYLHWRTGEVVRETTINVPADTTLHLFASEQFPGWYYILQFSSFYQRYGCSCYKGKQYARTQQVCEHMQQMLSREVCSGN